MNVGFNEENASSLFTGCVSVVEFTACWYVAKWRVRQASLTHTHTHTHTRTHTHTAMSFPATGMETAYRNNLKDVAKMLRTKHQENYMVGYSMHWLLCTWVALMTCT